MCAKQYRLAIHVYVDGALWFACISDDTAFGYKTQNVFETEIYIAQKPKTTKNTFFTFLSNLNKFAFSILIYMMEDIHSNSICHH